MLNADLSGAEKTNALFEACKNCYVEESVGLINTPVQRNDMHLTVSIVQIATPATDKRNNKCTQAAYERKKKESGDLPPFTQLRQCRL